MMKRRDRTREVIVAEYLSGGVSYREMELRHGIARSTLQHWVKKAGGKRVEKEEVEESGRGEVGNGERETEEIRRLRTELRRVELHNKLLNAMIDIAEEQYEIPIRKKPGAGR